MHHSSSSSSSPETSRSSSRQLGRHCGSINTNVVQQVVAAKWATDVINNQSLPYELKIGELQFASLVSPTFLIQPPTRRGTHWEQMGFFYSYILTFSVAMKVNIWEGNK